MRRTPTTIAALAISAMLTLAACGDDEEPSSEPTPKMTSSATEPNEPSPSEPTEPTAPPEIEGTDAKSAEAFVRYYFEVVNYAQATGDTKLLRSLAEPSCTACEGGTAYLEKIHKKGGTIEGGEYTVENAAGQRLHQSMRIDAKVGTTDQVVSGPGMTKKDFPASTRRWTFFLARVKTSWSVISFRIA